MKGISPHPRLHIGPTEHKRLTLQPKLDFLQEAQARLCELADGWVSAPPLTYAHNRHNEHLSRAREVQTRVITLLARWEQTGDARYRDAVMAHIDMIGSWESWSWITWRQGNHEPTAIYDLSYGENSATLAIAYDWLFHSLTDAEKARFVSIAERWSFASGRVHCKRGAAWWYGRPDSNWNTVCAGGLGMLCLAMYEDVPDAAALLSRVEKSFIPYMRYLDKTDGAWPEGVGYWNYGMHYAFTYLLSWQNTMRRRHPLLGLRGTKQTLAFPLDFAPHGQACSFGDVNHWSPLPIHYAVASDLACSDVVHAIDDRILRSPTARPLAGGWAPAASWLLFHDGKRPARRKSLPQGAKLYKGLDWGIIADRMPRPDMYLSVRGGTTEVPHGHNDLLSFNCVVGGEKLIANVGNSEYLDTTFSSRRYELPDINAQYKNTILINGVGVPHGAALDKTTVVKASGVEGIRMLATSAMGDSRTGDAARFCGRVFLMLKKPKIFVIVDRVSTFHAARMESRLHTFARTRLFRHGAQLSGGQSALRVAYGCNVPALLAAATTAPTTPTAPAASMLRWCTQKLHTDMIMVTLLAPGRPRAEAKVCSTEGKIRIQLRVGAQSAALELSEGLVPLDHGLEGQAKA